MQIKNILMNPKIVFAILFTIFQESQGQSISMLDSSEYAMLDSTISKSIHKALHKSNITTGKDVLLFSIRFNLDESGKIINLNGSAFAPSPVLDSLQNVLKGMKEQGLTKISKKAKLKENLIVLPIYIIPKADTANMGKNPAINVDMIRDLFLFSRMKYRKDNKNVYYYWRSPFSGLVLSPLSYPFREQMR